MKKLKPHYILSEIQELLDDENTRTITRRDRKEAVRLGYADDDAMVARVQQLKRAEFCKSQTAYIDNTLWQDYYKTEDEEVGLFIKLQISHTGEGVIISFKEDTGEDY